MRVVNLPCLGDGGDGRNSSFDLNRYTQRALGGSNFALKTAAMHSRLLVAGFGLVRNTLACDELDEWQISCNWGNRSFWRNRSPGKQERGAASLCGGLPNGSACGVLWRPDKLMTSGQLN